MASTEIPDSPDALISLATEAADGAASEGAAIGLTQNTAAKILADLKAVTGDPAATPPLPGTRNAYNAAKAAKVAANSNRRTVENSARTFCTSAVGMLKNYLGAQWNSQWQEAGFINGSLAIPDDPVALLGTLRGYFTSHAAHENAPLGLTAANCTANINAVAEARAASNQSVLDLGAAKAANETAVKALYKRLTGLRSELSQLLAKDDPRWYAFGFDRPADGWGPGPVEHLVLTAGSPGMIFADWDDARRAERYRVYKQITGVDAEPVEVTGGVTESEYTLTGLPSGATVQITVRAANAAGDGPVSATATLVVP